MEIKVRARHINHGIACDGHSCPVAKAIKEVFTPHDRHRRPIGKPPHVMVHSPKTPNSFDGYALIDGEEFLLPRKVQVWIYTFDNIGRDRVGPMEFALDRK